MKINSYAVFLLITICKYSSMWPSNKNDSDPRECEDASKNIGYDPVCGSDNKTYYNENALKCYIIIKIVYRGPCKPFYGKDPHLNWKGYGNYGKSRGNVWYKPFNRQSNNCGDGLCNSDKRCCDIKQRDCCMDDKGKCCNIHFPRTYIQPRWINTKHENKKKYWKCDNKRSSCKPDVCVPYNFSKAPCYGYSCKKPKKMECYLPPVPKCDNFDFDQYGRNFPFSPGHFPEPRFIDNLLIKGFNCRGGTIASDYDLFKCLFDDDYKSRPPTIAINIDMNIDVNIDKGAIIQKYTSRIPEQHKIIIRQYATIYYIFFFIMLEKNLCTEDTEVAYGYTVKHLLLFIIHECWGLTYTKMDAQKHNNMPDWKVKRNKGGQMGQTRNIQHLLKLLQSFTNGTKSYGSENIFDSRNKRGGYLDHFVGSSLN